MRRVRSTRLATILLALLVLSAGFTAPAVAQPETDGDTDDLPIDVPDEYTGGDGAGEDTDGGDSDSDDGDDEPTVGFDDDDEADDEDGDGDGEEADEDDGAPGAGGTEQVGGGDYIDSQVPTAGDLLEGGAAWVGEAATNVIHWIVGETLGIAVGTPTPENAGWMGIFGEPTNEPFASLYEEIHNAWILPLTLSFFAIAIFLSATAMPFSGFVGRYSASRWVAMMFVALFAVALGWPIVTTLHMLSDSIGTAIAPSSEELLGSGEGLQTLATASVPAAGGLYLFGWVKVMVYALIYGMRYFLLLMIMPYVFPFALAVALTAPWRKLRGMGSMILWAHVGLLIVNLPAALLWRAAFVIEWGFSPSTFVNILMIMGALVAAVVIPVVIMYQTTRLTGVVSGAVGGAATSIRNKDSYTPRSVGHAKAAAGRARDAGRSAVDQAHTARDATRWYQSRTIHEPWDGPATARQQRSTGTTQAQRKQVSTDGSGKRKMRLHQTANGWAVRDR